jgi:ribosome-binding protein aMBF1 (putative translation factor)
MSKNFFDMRMGVALTLRERLAEKGLAPVDLAFLMEQKNGTITKWLSGLTNFRIDELSEIEAYGGIQLVGVCKN